jgi:hypothetical protein
MEMLMTIENDDNNVDDVYDDNKMVHIMNLQWTSDTPI